VPGSAESGSAAGALRRLLEQPAISLAILLSGPLRGVALGKGRPVTVARAGQPHLSVGTIPPGGLRSSGRSGSSEQNFDYAGSRRAGVASGSGKLLGPVCCKAGTRPQPGADGGGAASAQRQNRSGVPASLAAPLVLSLGARLRLGDRADTRIIFAGPTFAPLGASVGREGRSVGTKAWAG